MQIRPAVPEDATVISELLAALGYPATPAQVRERLSTLDDSDCVLLTDGGLIALHRIPRLAEGDVLTRITALVVAPEHRSKGVGRALLRAGEGVASRWGSRLLEVSSGRRPERDAAHALYRAEGFEDAGTDSARYWRRLDPE